MLWLIVSLEFLMGCLFHFVYDFFPCAAWAWLFPINESIFEHLKLAFYPLVIVHIFFYPRVCHRRFVAAVFYGALTSIMSVALLYYFYTSAFHLYSLSADILLLFIALWFGELMIKHIYTYLDVTIVWPYVVNLLFLFVFFILGTYFPLSFPLFIDMSA